MEKQAKQNFISLGQCPFNCISFCFQDSFLKSSSQQDLLPEPSVHDHEKEAEHKRRRKLIFIFLVAAVTTVLLALAATIPFLLGKILIIGNICICFTNLSRKTNDILINYSDVLMSSGKVLKNFWWL